MQELGVDLSHARTKAVDPQLRERFHYVVPHISRRHLAAKVAD
jgi:hypothetical protein